MIGEKLYLRDENRRSYIDQGGRRTVDAANHWVGVTITGETKQSWLAEYNGRPICIAKKDRAIGGIREFYGLDRCAYTAQERDDWLWLRENHARIVREVEDCRDLDKLRAIAALLDA